MRTNNLIVEIEHHKLIFLKTFLSYFEIKQSMTSLRIRSHSIATQVRASRKFAPSLTVIRNDFIYCSLINSELWSLGGDYLLRNPSQRRVITFAVWQNQ